MIAWPVFVFREVPSSDALTVRAIGNLARHTFTAVSLRTAESNSGHREKRVRDKNRYGSSVWRDICRLRCKTDDVNMMKVKDARVAGW